MATALFILSLHCCCFRKVILLSKIYCFSVSFFFFLPLFTSIATSAETPSSFKFTKSSVTITSFQRITKPQTQTKKKLSPALWPLSKKKTLTKRKSQFFIYLKKWIKKKTYLWNNCSMVKGGFHVFEFLKLKTKLSFRCQTRFWKYLGIIEL